MIGPADMLGAAEEGADARRLWRGSKDGGLLVNPWQTPGLPGFQMKMNKFNDKVCKHLVSRV